MELVEIFWQKRGHFEKLFRLAICASLFWPKIQVSYKFEQKQSSKFWQALGLHNNNVPLVVKYSIIAVDVQ